MHDPQDKLEGTQHFLKRFSLDTPQRRRIAAYLITVLIDSGMILTALIIAALVRFATVWPSGMTEIAATTCVTTLALSLNGDNYRSVSLASWRIGAIEELSSIGIATILIIFVGFFVRVFEDIPRDFFALAISGNLILIPIGRYAANQVANYLLGPLPRKAVLIVDGMNIDPPPGVDVLDVRREGLAVNSADPKSLDAISRRFHRIDDVYIFCEVGRRKIWSQTLLRINTRAELIIPELDEWGGVSSRRFAGLPTVIVSGGPLRIRDRALKRALDLAIVIPSLILLSPAFLAITIAIAIDSRGPILFNQSRIGYKNKTFRIHKFRSMLVTQQDPIGNQSASRDDARITKVGRLLRRTSLDELPQLINILKGEMSFVGPRPHALGSRAESQLFWAIDDKYFNRHVFKPGLTGLAQIKGFRGATNYRSDLVNRVGADLAYIENWTIFRDISIIASTFFVLRHPNAY